MRLLRPVLFLALFPYIPAVAQVFVVRHAATQNPAASEATGLAPGSLCEIVVTGLYQPRGPLTSSDVLTFRLRTAGGLDVEISALTPQPTSASITAVIPKEAPGTVQIVAISKATGREFTVAIPIRESNFGIFSRDRTGFGPALAQVFRQQTSLVGLTTPVRPGDWITLWGTGLGSWSGNTVAVGIGEQWVLAAYAGPAPGFPGLDQINVQIPESIPQDCYVPLNTLPGLPATRAVGAPPPPVSLPVSTGTNCNHRLGLTNEQLRLLDERGRLLAPTASVSSQLAPIAQAADLYIRNERIYVPFTTSGQGVIQTLTGVSTERRPECVEGVVAAPSTVLVGSNNADREVTGPGNFREVVPNGIYSTPTSTTAFSLDAVPATIFVPGEWRLNVTGGLSLPFNTRLRVPPPIRWNRSGLSPVSRISDLTLRWNPEGYTEAEWMKGGISVGGRGVLCSVPAKAGSITIPAGALQRVPEATRADATLELYPANTNLVSFEVPVESGVPGRGLATFSYSERIQVDIR